MYDVERIKESVDCRDLVKPRLGEPKARSAKANLYPCPMHEERHGTSLAVYKDGWKCFGKCDTSGDAITWVQWDQHVSFEQACRILGGELVSKTRRQVSSPPPAPKLQPAAPPSNEWQAPAIDIVERAQEVLWSAEGAQHLDYLRGRGLTDDTIRQAYLGSVPGLAEKWHFWEGLAIPPGITIPRFADLELWGIKVRQFPKAYVQVGTTQKAVERLGKGALAGGLYWADHIIEGWPIVVCEGEFDCLILSQAAGDLVCPVTVGSATTAINPRWYATLAVARPLIACFDKDQAGEKGAARLGALAPYTRVIAVPDGKDINDYYLASGSSALHEWMQSVIRGNDQ